ncbi:hypothetical protein [Bacillus sp. MUM 116]|uniref:hypothetical protein n=1 Tax=Bacillus sp. MUM 116 TaxID=1678002 RepID=UPI00210A6D8D|nr:hypothetical protein [Bacillus sp. MUM 116]
MWPFKRKKKSEVNIESPDFITRQEIREEKQIEKIANKLKVVLENTKGEVVYVVVLIDPLVILSDH